MRLELSRGFAQGSAGWAKWNDLYNSEQITKWNVMALLWSIKGGNFFLNVPYLFWLITDLRKPKVYPGLVEGQRADLICGLSSLNEPCMGHSVILCLSDQENYQRLANPTYTILSFQKLQHLAQCLAHSGCSLSIYWVNKSSRDQRSAISGQERQLCCPDVSVLNIACP